MRERFPSLDADDVIQETLVAVCKVMPSYRYDPDVKGHFRSYLTGILRHRALRMLREESRCARLVADMQRESVADSSLPAEPDDAAWREAVFETALARFLADPSVADRTKRIFERTAGNGESPEAVAAAFKMTRHAVDQAKSRAMSRLRELVRELESVAGESRFS